MGAKDDDDGREARAARLAQALRENLKRRKGQARARRAAASEAEPAPTPPDDDEPDSTTR